MDLICSPSTCSSLWLSLCVCVSSETQMRTNIIILRQKHNCQNPVKAAACICVSFLLGFEELPPPQVLRNEDSRLRLTFTFLFPQQWSGGDGCRGKQKQEETFLTVTAISASVISISLLPRDPVGSGDSERTRGPLGALADSSPHAVKHHKHTWTKRGIFTRGNHLWGPAPLHVSLSVITL